jgi:glycosyltransferase involved in cell wall biosynthesis
MKISVVAGCAKQHLFGTISEFHKRDILGVAYVPMGIMLKKSNPLRKVGTINRAASRFPELELVPKRRVNLPEVFYQLGLWFSRHNIKKSGEFLTEFSHRLFSIIVNQKLNNDDSDVLIVRCGFGNHIKAVEKLRVCELSMAHPLVDLSLISGNGFSLSTEKELGRVGKLMLSDLRRADRILVNSEFVKKTCILAGEDPSKIYVSYLPPAHELIQKFEEYKNTSLDVKIHNKVLFVGTLSQRKGIDLFLEIAKEFLRADSDLEFVAIGNWSGMSLEFKQDFLSTRNISIIPWVSREELVEHYVTSFFLLCPTRSDGGARVITEAMLFGNVVITSTVSGSPIRSGDNGFEVDIENEQYFIGEVLRILSDRDRTSQIGARASRSAYLDLSFENYMINVLKACSIV